MIKGVVVQRTTIYYLVSVAAVFALCVIVLGAYTRLTNAGLGCPDWPGCYGHVIVPQTQGAVAKAENAFPRTPIEPVKAWTEMIHRYFAMTLGLFIMAIAVISFGRRKRQDQPKLLPSLLVLALVFQAALGMWTVTLKLLPVVVMGHLLGGFTIVSLLWCLRLQLDKPLLSEELQAISRFRPFALLGLVIVGCQIALGGWVSSNYAGLACIGFPYCNGILLPHLNLHDAFNLASPIGANYQGGLLDSPTRMTIQMVHRIGAVVTASYLLIIAIWVLRKSASHRLQQIAAVILTLVCIQFTLGVINVTEYLPLSVAVAHNAVAALLLLSVVTLTYRVYAKPLENYHV